MDSIATLVDVITKAGPSTTLAAVFGYLYYTALKAKEAKDEEQVKMIERLITALTVSTTALSASASAMEKSAGAMEKMQRSINRFRNIIGHGNRDDDDE